MVIKLFRLSILAVLFVTAVNASQSVEALPGDPTYFCYGQTPTGRIVNLNNLCTQNPELPAKPVVETSSQSFDAGTKPQPAQVKPQTTTAKKTASPRVAIRVARELQNELDFSSLKYENGVLSGSVRNKTGRLVDDGAVAFEVRASGDSVNWKIVGRGYACFANDSLSPKQTTKFQGVGYSSGRQVLITKMVSCRR